MELHSLEKVIAEHPFFAGLAAEYTHLLVSCARNERFEAGEYVFKEGEQANEFYLIREGRVAIEILLPHQRSPMVVETVGEDEILGWSWLFPPYVWHSNGRAVVPTRAITLNGECLRRKCEENHDLGYELLKRFSQVVCNRLDAARFQLLDVYAASR